MNMYMNTLVRQQDLYCVCYTFWFKNRSCLEYGNFIDHRDVEASHIQDCSVHSAENGQPLIVLHTSLCVCQIKIIVTPIKWTNHLND